MKYLYNNEFEDVYESDIGTIAKVMDSDSKFNSKLMYVAGGTLNGYCYKDYNNFENKPNDVCYIAECCFDKTLFVDYVNENKEKLIKDGGIATANSIKEEVRNALEYEEYYYEYQKDGIVHTIEAKKFDEDLIYLISKEVFDAVDWQTTQGYIYEVDWRDYISDYYHTKFNDEETKLFEKVSLDDLNMFIKKWYIENYPSDEVGITLSPTVTFLDLNNLLNSGNGYYTYELLGGDADSIVRERCFEKLAEITNQNYCDIYDKWLNKLEINGNEI